MQNDKNHRSEELISYLEWRNKQFLETDRELLLFLQ